MSSKLRWLFWIIVVVASVLAACDEAGERVRITPDLTTCDEHRDCTLVETACNQCCMTGSITASRMKAFEAAYEDECSGYSGGICDCAPPDVIARCVDGHCAAVPRGAIAECFSPTQNRSSAFEDDAIGCTCDGDEPRVCTPDGALECTGLPSGTAAWQAMEDPTCVVGEDAGAADAG